MSRTKDQQPIPQQQGVNFGVDLDLDFDLDDLLDPFATATDSELEELAKKNAEKVPEREAYKGWDERIEHAVAGFTKQVKLTKTHGEKLEESKFIADAQEFYRFETIEIDQPKVVNEQEDLRCRWSSNATQRWINGLKEQRAEHNTDDIISSTDFVIGLASLHSHWFTKEQVEEFTLLAQYDEDTSAKEFINALVEEHDQELLVFILASAVEIKSRPEKKELTTSEQQLLDLAEEINERGSHFYNQSRSKEHGAYHGDEYIILADGSVELKPCGSCAHSIDSQMQESIEQVEQRAEENPNNESETETPEDQPDPTTDYFAALLSFSYYPPTEISNPEANYSTSSELADQSSFTTSTTPFIGSGWRDKSEDSSLTNQSSPVRFSSFWDLVNIDEGFGEASGTSSKENSDEVKDQSTASPDKDKSTDKKKLVVKEPKASTSLTPKKLDITSTAFESIKNKPKDSSTRVDVAPVTPNNSRVDNNQSPATRNSGKTGSIENSTQSVADEADGVDSGLTNESKLLDSTENADQDLRVNNDNNLLTLDGSTSEESQHRFERAGNTEEVTTLEEAFRQLAEKEQQAKFETADSQQSNVIEVTAEEEQQIEAIVTQQTANETQTDVVVEENKEIIVEQSTNEVVEQTKQDEAEQVVAKVEVIKDEQGNVIHVSPTDNAQREDAQNQSAVADDIIDQVAQKQTAANVKALAISPDSHERIDTTDPRSARKALAALQVVLSE